MPQNPDSPRRAPRSLAMLAAVLSLPCMGQDQPAAEDDQVRAKQEKHDQQMKQDEVAMKALKDGLAKQGGVKAPTGAAGATSAAQPGRVTASPAGGDPTGSAQPKVPITVSGGATPGLGSATAQGLRPDEVSLSTFSEAMDLKALVEYVAMTLQINIVAADSLQGTVVLNAPVVVKKSELLALLDALLEQHNFTIIPDIQTGFYKVVPIDGVTVVFDGELATTRVIPTPTIRPSSLAGIISSQIGIAAGGPAIPGQPQGGGRDRINYVDDLGVIIVTDSPRRIALIEQIVNVVMARAADQQFIRFDLEHLAASTARSRILELVGRSPSAQAMFPQGNPQVAQGLAAALNSANFDNLSDRLMADAQSNALILRGYPEEETKIKSLLAILDKPNAMAYKQYFAGSAALQIAQLAERFGFGSVETVETIASQNQPGQLAPGGIRPQQPQGINQLQFGAQAQQGTLGGPVLVVDPSRGAITYNGTPSQQAALEKLISSFNPELEVVEFRAYKIKNMPAVEMNDLLYGLIFNEEVSRSDTNNSFLPGSGGGSSGGSRRDRSRYRDSSGSGSRSSRTSREEAGQSQNTGRANTAARTPRVSSSAGAGARGPLALTPNQATEGDGVSNISSNDVFLLPDEANNQVVVKATARDHDQIAKLIDKLDQRRPQVYIEVQIVSVSATDDFRLAFEVQGVGEDGAFNTNFGLGTFAGTTTGSTTTPGNFVGPKSVVTTLAGLTAAVVRADQVPIIMTALKRNADTRILSNPQLLVDDNEFAEIVSLDEQPTTGTDIGNSTTQTSFTGFESAGTTLAVSPSISEGGYLRLEYEIELSNFVGTGSNGVPPPRQTRNISSSSVSIPGGATIVVGGIKVDSQGNTIVKVPLLGDIPLVGILFRDTNKNKVTTRLYVFITPRIMRDQNFGDRSLLTKGRAEESGIRPDTPALEPIMIELNEKPRAIPMATPMAKREEEAEQGIKP